MKNGMRRKSGLYASVLVLVILLCNISACNKNNTQVNGNTSKITLCEVTHSVFYAPLYAAIELGYFDDAGIDLELINGGGADKVMTAVISGQADIGFAGPEACIYTYLEGQKDYPKIFGQLTKRDGSFIVGREKQDFSWEKLKGTTILGGRKGGVPEMTLEYVLKAHNIIPGKDIDVDTSVQFNMMAGAFTGGAGDYVTLFEPTATELELSGEGFVLASVGEESGEIPYTAFFASQIYMNNNTELIRSFVSAVTKGLTWVQNSDSSEIAKVLQAQFPDTSLEVLSQVVERYRDIDAWNDSLIMKKESFDRLQDVMEEAGELNQRVEFEAIVDNTMVPKSLLD
ncbi:ABC transporter substrate-binding protein [Butyrivibrio sp. AC2005]|uniref:ABC transporter substrate-binding protein n=1 Tax=Butyrivibrio sp. AC2005 TaxID=1280672 RepID=UPI000408E43B|nr:ABC transporter substrate-binding protein [Butyrivibrio sp. AC2005]